MKINDVVVILTIIIYNYVLFFVNQLGSWMVYTLKAEWLNNGDVVILVVKKPVDNIIHGFVGEIIEEGKVIVGEEYYYVEEVIETKIGLKARMKDLVRGYCITVLVENFLSNNEVFVLELGNEEISCL